MTWQEPPSRSGRPPNISRRGAARTPGWSRRPEESDEDWLSAPSTVIPVAPEAGASSTPPPTGENPVQRGRALVQPEWSPSSKSASPVTGSQPVVRAAEPEGDLGAASLVRPYARTGGRTRPVRNLDLEALVLTSANGRDALGSPQLSPEHINVIHLASGTVSVAEIAARIAVPLGVARVIIADMVDLGLVEVMKTSATEGDERDPAFLRRVLSGLQRL